LFSLCIRPPGAMAMDLVEALLGIRYGWVAIAICSLMIL
jgi:hypothetical protein